jgi:hypothetical protein
MIRQRAAAGIKTQVGNHTFRATGIRGGKKLGKITLPNSNRARSALDTEARGARVANR